MSELRFDFTWRDIPGSRDPAIRNCMADLRILVGDEAVTRAFDRGSRTVQESVLVSLYPLAEWVAANWWPLLEENLVSGRDDRRSFEDRHFLACADEGFALPRLGFFPEGEAILLKWHPFSFRFQSIEFIGKGIESLPTDGVRESLGGLVEAVLKRLASFGVTDTWLGKEWDAITGLDPSEVEYCQAVARMGLDPFDLPEGIEEAVLQVSSTLPGSVTEDVFRCASPSDLLPACGWISEGLAGIARSSSKVPSLEGIRSKLRNGAPGAPWQQGYNLARDLHNQLGMPAEPPVRLETILGVDLPLFLANTPPPRSIDGLVGKAGESAFCCYTAKRRPESSRFLMARAMGAFLEDGHALPSVLSTAVTQKQKRNRAFAAEFLAPKDLLKQFLPSGSLSAEDIEDVSRLFEVSPRVIEHQVVNHKLARIIDTDSTPIEQV